MKKRILIICSFIITSNSYAQLTDLCGIWVGYNFQCFTQNPDGTTNTSFITEILSIEHEGSVTTATKIIGDACVQSGQMSWQGRYDQNPFAVNITTGSEQSPQSSVASGTIIVIDSSRLEFSQSRVYFIKASCAQIESFNIDLPNIKCLDCVFDAKIEMPNVFTPNNDGVNDLFIPVKFSNVELSELFIYNSWGNLMYSSKEPSTGWDGQNKEKKCVDGAYYWIMNCVDNKKNNYSTKGMLMLLGE